MFFTGNLQEGIALAVKESKAVLCFVYDDSYPSKSWEETIEEEEVAAVIARHAIALRIVQGSQEAQFMAPFRQASSAPVIVIIKDRKVKASFSHPEASDTLKSRLLAAFGQKPPFTQPATHHSDQGQVQDHDQVSLSPPLEAARPNSPSARPLPEWQIQKRAREKRERDEIDRIRALINDDSAERRHRGDVRKPHTETSPSLGPSTSLSPLPSVRGQVSTPPPKLEPQAQIRIQIRLLDGSTSRSAFSGEATISSHIRPWIKSLNTAAAAASSSSSSSEPEAEEEVEDDSTPYKLKLILAPFPNRTIQPTEEDLPLSELDLGSTCTLIVVPIRNFSTSYSASSSARSGLFMSVLGRIYTFLTGFLFGFVAVLGRVFGSIPTLPRRQQQQEQSHDGATSTGLATGSMNTKLQPGAGGIRVRTLADQRRDEEEAGKEKGGREFYNGNQLSFQPRKKEDGDGDGEGEGEGH